MILGKMQAGLIMLVGYALRAEPTLHLQRLQRLGHVAVPLRQCHFVMERRHPRGSKDPDNH